MLAEQLFCEPNTLTLHTISGLCRTLKLLFLIILAERSVCQAFLEQRQGLRFKRKMTASYSHKIRQIYFKYKTFIRSIFWPRTEIMYEFITGNLCKLGNRNVGLAQKIGISNEFKNFVRS